MATTVDINADLGEGADPGHLAHDIPLLSMVSSANIACGYHAGNASTMAATVRAASDRGVAIGAHPSYPDLKDFGRRELGLSGEQIHFHVAAQIRAMASICATDGAPLRFVKPHGALYNRAATDTIAARAIVAAMVDVDSSLILLGLANSQMQLAAQKSGLRFASEAFVDRAYQSDGTLLPRSSPNAVIADTNAAVSRTVQLLTDGFILSDDGSPLTIQADSLCVHGDNPDAVTLLRALRAALDEVGVVIAPFA